MRTFWVAVAIVLIVMAAFAVGLWWYLPVPHNSTRYTAEDLTVYAQVFGGTVGTLVAALAFAGLIYTALMQREELSLQREELRETRAELKRTADAQEASGKALQAQVATAELTARLNAATALLEHYRELVPPGGYIIATTPEQKAKAIEFEKDAATKINDVLDEIISLRDELRDVVHLELRATIGSLTGGVTVQSDKQA